MVTALEIGLQLKKLHGFTSHLGARTVADFVNTAMEDVVATNLGKAAGWTMGQAGEAYGPGAFGWDEIIGGWVESYTLGSVQQAGLEVDRTTQINLLHIYGGMTRTSNIPGFDEDDCRWAGQQAAIDQNVFRQSHNIVAEIEHFLP